MEEQEKWWKDEDKILILPKLEEVIWERNWDKKYYNLIGRTFIVQGYSLGDYIIQDGDNYFRIPTDCAVPPDSQDNIVTHPLDKVRWYNKGKLEEKLITKFNMFEGIEDIDPYGEEDWEDKNIPEYFYGEISFDNIEVTPCIVDGQEVKRVYDNYILRTEDDYNIEAFIDIQSIFVMNIPYESELQPPKDQDKLIYIYGRNIDREQAIERLLVSINQSCQSKKYKERFIFLLKIFDDDIITFEPNGKIVNLL